MSWRSLRWLLLVGLSVAACSERGGGPSAPDLLHRSLVRPPAVRWNGQAPSLVWQLAVEPDSGGPGPVFQAAPLPQPLESYVAAFPVANWRGATLQISYADDAGPGRSSRPFLKLIIPRGALYRWPGGWPVGPFGVVPVVVRVDPTEVLVDFWPSGLRFTPACPVLLQIWYGGAVGDSVSAAARAGLKLWHREPGGEWTVLSAEHSPVQGWFKAHICGFSSYQISY